MISLNGWMNTSLLFTEESGDCGDKTIAKGDMLIDDHEFNLFCRQAHLVHTQRALYPI